MNEKKIAMLVTGLSYSEKPSMLKKKLGDENFIVKNINIKLRVGEIIGIVGEAGSGKTTFGRLLTGEIKPTHGNIFLRPEDDVCIEIDEIERRLRHINIELHEKYGKEAETGEDEERDTLRTRFAEIAAESSTEGKIFQKSGKNTSLYMVSQDVSFYLNQQKPYLRL
jgi:ABC-type oligopeptide transport system, ATPase component